VEIIGELSFVVQAGNFAKVVSAFQQFAGKTSVLKADTATAEFQIPTGVKVRITNTPAKLWGLAMLITTGSEKHLAKLLESGYDLAALTTVGVTYGTDQEVYRKLGLQPIPAELREGLGEIALAASGHLRRLITQADIRGELHAHTTSSDGVHTVEQMAAAARENGYEYLGITDHSQSLKIAQGLSEAELWAQIRHIDRLNDSRGGETRILKSAEVDILVDGALDYPDALLKELDYTVCSIHSRFGLNKNLQTERIMRAMDNRYFNILGHATGRRLLKRPGYELDFDRMIEHARKNGCFFEINASPERLDLSWQNAAMASQAGVKIAINTDAHSAREFAFLTCGIEQARRAGLDRGSVLNCLPWSKLRGMFQR
jgi:DNA polymerase (family 10)